jgi:hypothetical protein
MGAFRVGTALLFVLAVGCGGSSDTSNGAGGTGDASSGGSGATSSGGSSNTGGSNAGGSNTGGTSSGGAAGACHGDAAAWATITAGPFPCSKNSDCCVAINDCTNQAQIMLKADFDNGGPDKWPYCASDCTDCIPPAVEIVCSMGSCGLVSTPTTPQQSIQSRCGDDSVNVTGVPKQLIGCGG